MTDTDFVRRYANSENCGRLEAELLAQAADEIDALRAEIESWGKLPQDIDDLVNEACKYEPHTTRRNIAAMKLGCLLENARARIEELEKKLKGKRTSPNVTTICECPDCGAMTRWSRHLDMDCETIQTLRALVKRHEEALEKAFSGDFKLFKNPPNEYGVIFGKPDPDKAWRAIAETPLAAIEAALKEPQEKFSVIKVTKEDVENLDKELAAIGAAKEGKP